MARNPVFMLSAQAANQLFHVEREEALRRARRLVSALLDLADAEFGSQDLMDMQDHNHVLSTILESLGGPELAALPARPASTTGRATCGTGK